MKFPLQILIVKFTEARENIFCEKKYLTYFKQYFIFFCYDKI